jgi:hypothetical protein
MTLTNPKLEVDEKCAKCGATLWNWGYLPAVWEDKKLCLDCLRVEHQALTGPKEIKGAR